MIMVKELNEKVKIIAEDIENRKINEERDILEKELSDIDFEIAFDKNLYGVFIMVIVLFVSIILKVLGEPIIKSYIFDVPFEFNLLYICGAFIMGVCILASILTIIYCSTKKCPVVRKSNFIYKGKTYHYRQISKVKMSAGGTATVFVDGKKVFSISRGYVHYDSFICWLKKCMIPVEGSVNQKKALTESQMTRITNITVGIVGTIFILAIIAITVFIIFEHI